MKFELGYHEHLLKYLHSNFELYFSFFNCDLSVIGIIGCVLQKSNKPQEKSCGLDCYRNYPN